MQCLQNNFRSIQEIPLPYRSVFQKYPRFNVVQSAVLDEAVKTDNSLVVSAPTGSGKTAIFEMAVIRNLMLGEETPNASNNKIIYISPIKALCKERLIDWHKKFADFGVRCISATSDSDDLDAKNILQYNLIITTPEKWDVLTRRWRENTKLIGSISLFLIDEVHLLNADSRGSTLEVIVSRMKTAVGSLSLTQENSSIRFIALSATIPNIEDIAEWIGPTETVKHFKFSEDVRPVKLNKIVMGYHFNPQSQSVFKFDMSLSYKLSGLISRHSNGKPTLIFCNTRKSVEMTASHLVSNLQIRLSQEQKEGLMAISRKLSDVKLKQYIVHGIAFHHAGLVQDNRCIIEECFRRGRLPVLVTTSTLAMGVNLPAHLVIVKSTKCYAEGGYKDYDEVSIFQMIGRAGRSQFDSSATALILTSTQDKAKYEQMLGCSQVIESNLHKHLTEHLNAEVVLRTITDLEVAMRWLSSTFLYVRARRSPEKYKLPAGLSKEKIDKKLLEMCQIDLNKLVSAGMVKMNQAIEVTPTVVGEIMAKYYVAFDTMKLFTQISGSEILIQILAIISKCKEFSEIYLRNNDKKCLNLLNKNSNKESNRFPLTGRIKTLDMKINVIIQAVLGNLDIHDQSILCDAIKVMRNCERLARCLIEYIETRNTCHSALLNTIILVKCFRVKLWENSPYVSKQLTGVGQVISTLLVRAGKTSFKEIASTNPRQIEMIVNRKAPFGNTLVDEASHLPQYRITLDKRDNTVELLITLLNPKEIEEKPTISLDSIMTLLVGDSNNNILIYEKYAHAYMLDNSEVRRKINVEAQNLDYIKANLISENWVGIDCSYTLELTNKVQTFIENKKKNCKQSFMDMYMSKVKRANAYQKKKEIKSALTSSVKKTELSETIDKQPSAENNLENNNNGKRFTENEELLDFFKIDNDVQNWIGKSEIQTNSKGSSSFAKKAELQEITHKQTPVANMVHTIITDRNIYGGKIKDREENKNPLIEGNHVDKEYVNRPAEEAYSLKERNNEETKDATNHKTIIKKTKIPRANQIKISKSIFRSKSKDKRSKLKRSISRKVSADDTVLSETWTKAIIEEMNGDNNDLEEENQISTSTETDYSKLEQKSDTTFNKLGNEDDKSNSGPRNVNVPGSSKLHFENNEHNKSKPGTETRTESEHDSYSDSGISDELFRAADQIDEICKMNEDVFKTPFENNESGYSKLIKNQNSKCEIKSADTGPREILRSNSREIGDVEINNRQFGIGDKTKGKNLQNSATQNFIDGKFNSSSYGQVYKKYTRSMEADNKSDKSQNIVSNQENVLKKNMDNPDSTVDYGTFQINSSQSKMQNKGDRYATRFEVFPQKSIKWRSPLVHSPAVKYSPHTRPFCFDFGDRGSESNKEDTGESNDPRLGTQEDTSNSSINSIPFKVSQKRVNDSIVSEKLIKKKPKYQFPLSDEDYNRKDKNESFNKKGNELDEVCDLDYFDLSNKQKESTANSSATTKSYVGKYYSQLVMNSLRKMHETCSKPEENSQPKTITRSTQDAQNKVTVAEQGHQSQDRFSQNASPTQCQNVVSSANTAKTYHTMQPLTQPVSMEYYHNRSNSALSGRNGFDGIDTFHQTLPNIRKSNSNDCLNRSFTGLPNYEELTQRRHINPYLDERRHPARTSRNFGHQQPFYERRSEMLPRFPVSASYPCMCCGHHPSTYADVNHHYGPYFDPVVERNPCWNHLHRASHSYGPRIDDIPEPYIDHCIQQLDDQPASFVGYSSLPHSTKEFRHVDDFIGNVPNIKADEADRSTSNFEARRGAIPYEKENRNTNNLNQNQTNFNFGEDSSCTPIFETETQNSVQHADDQLQESRMFRRNNITQTFAATPKTRLAHIPSDFNLAQNKRPMMSRNVQPPASMPPSARRRLLNFNSFEARLDDMIVPSERSMACSATREQHFSQPSNYIRNSYPNEQIYFRK